MAVKKKKAPKAKLVKKAKTIKKTKTAKPVKKVLMKNMNADAMLTPLEDRLLVQPDEALNQTAGGIIIPGSVSSKPNHGVVLAVGRGRRTKKGKLLPLDVSVGDQVMFADYSGSKIMLAGQEVLILREADVLGILS